ncbi:MAG: substrate-binding domain-containing protein [Cyanobacteria bacterium P01_F01_bin.150]
MNNQPISNNRPFKKTLLMLLGIGVLLSGCQTQQAAQPSVGEQESDTTIIDENGIAQGDTSEMRIAFSISFIKESSFRQTMVNSFEQTATAAQQQGLIKDFTVLDADQSVETQIKQIESLIEADYDAITILPGSATELNGVVKTACDAGIVVVDFNAEVTEPCSHTVGMLWEQYGAVQGSYLGTRLDQGNLLEVRGAPGNTSDTDISASIHASLADFPELNVVESVQGYWLQDVAQTAVEEILPTLPDISAVVTQGGDGYGTALAFAASDRPMPIIIMGNRYEELKWWQEQRDASGYQTVSASATPSISSVAFWTAQQILAGKKDVPKYLGMPILVIEDETLDKWLAITSKGEVATPDYTQAWTVKLIDAQNLDAPLPLPPLPGGL